jgi:hypothetical protein
MPEFLDQSIGIGIELTKATGFLPFVYHFLPCGRKMIDIKEEKYHAAAG